MRRRALIVARMRSFWLCDVTRLDYNISSLHSLAAARIVTDNLRYKLKGYVAVLYRDFTVYRNPKTFVEK